MTRVLASLTLILGVSLAAAGCSDSRKSNGASGGGPQNATASTPSVPGGAPANTATPSAGIVGALTGDDDSQVSKEVEALVYQANLRGEQDQPLDF